MSTYNTPPEEHYFIEDSQWLDRDEIEEELQKIKTQISTVKHGLTISLEVEDIELVGGYYEGTYLTREVSLYIDFGDDDYQYIIDYWEKEKDDKILDDFYNNEEIYEDYLKDNCHTVQQVIDKTEWLEDNLPKLYKQFEEDCFVVLKDWFTEITFGGWCAGHYPLKKTYKETLEPNE